MGIKVDQGTELRVHQWKDDFNESLEFSSECFFLRHLFPKNWDK